MNWNRKPEKQPELFLSRTRTVRTHTAAEFFAVCARERAGELDVTAMAVFGDGTGNGGRNGWYEFEVRLRKETT